MQEFISWRKRTVQDSRKPMLLPYFIDEILTFDRLRGVVFPRQVYKQHILDLSDVRICKGGIRTLRYVYFENLVPC